MVLITVYCRHLYVLSFDKNFGRAYSAFKNISKIEMKLELLENSFFGVHKWENDGL